MPNPPPAPSAEQEADDALIEQLASNLSVKIPRALACEGHGIAYICFIADAMPLLRDFLTQARAAEREKIAAALKIMAQSTYLDTTEQHCLGRSIAYQWADAIRRGHADRLAPGGDLAPDAGREAR